MSDGANDNARLTHVLDLLSAALPELARCMTDQEAMLRKIAAENQKWHTLFEALLVTQKHLVQRMQDILDRLPPDPLPREQ